jgi:uncharacterized alpha-E superfamily protein
MALSKTIVRLRWHAGLEEGPTDEVPSIASSTWPRGRLSENLEPALLDCFRTLSSLNRELNGEVASSAVAHSGDLPRSLVYAVSEIVRLLRECQEEAGNQRDARWFARSAWRVETAWSAVLAGDIDDILEHLENEEAMRFS